MGWVLSMRVLCIVQLQYLSPDDITLTSEQQKQATDRTDSVRSVVYWPEEVTATEVDSVLLVRSCSRPPPIERTNNFTM